MTEAGRSGSQPSDQDFEFPIVVEPPKTTPQHDDTVISPSDPFSDENASEWVVQSESTNRPRVPLGLGPRVGHVKPPVIREATCLTADSGAQITSPVVESGSPVRKSRLIKSNSKVGSVLKRGLSSISNISKKSGNSSRGESERNPSESSATPSDPSDVGSEHARAVGIHFLNDNVYVLPASINEMNNGRPNKIKTSKYTWWTWIPKSLYGQFKRVANVYFLFIAIIVCFPFSPKDPRSKVGPFVMVLLWTALKDKYEDNRRKRDDEKENKQETLKFDPITKCLVPTVWQDVKYGDCILVRMDSAFPADMILLWTADAREAYMSTVMLDGETSLKERIMPKCFERLTRNIRKSKMSQAPTELPAQTDEANLRDVEGDLSSFMSTIMNMGLEVQVGAPSEVVSIINGRLMMGGGLGFQRDSNSSNRSEMSREASLVSETTNVWKAVLEAHFLPRGCVLRNTSYVLGLVVYAGAQTKTRMKANEDHSKFSNMQVNLNWCVRGLLVVLLLTCIYLATASKLVGESDESWIVMVMRYLIALYHVVPMSLYIVYEILKLILGYQVNMDPQMIDPETEQGAIARTADVMEEMGQIDFVFSDKTGTLTRNEMVFARCHAGGQDLGDFRSSRESIGQGNQCARDLIQQAWAGEGDQLAGSTFWLFTCLAVCHSVRVDKTDGKYAFHGMSPDEVALVEVAHEVGITFESRERNPGSTRETLKIIVGSAEKTVTLFNVFEFSSERKRMSVIVQIDGKFYCITKGADTTIEERLKSPLTDICKTDILRFSREGLRVLMVATNSLSRQCYQDFQKDMEAAKRILDHQTKEQRIEELMAKMEVDLEFAGLTAVEDRLQEGVVEAIDTLKQAGIRVWMLTGDKLETAVDVARSCQLFTETTQLAFITQACDEVDTLAKLEDASNQLRHPGEYGLVLDGMSLFYAMQSQECKRYIYDLGLKSKTCVCCRLSPTQKLQLVQMVQSVNKKALTLGIGDGANDVPMIKGAHLGIAVRGREGAQAVQASDVAISQFRFLVPLLLCHGRRAYRRVALFLCYYLYKNSVLIFGDLVWAHQQGFLGNIAYPEYLSIGFNVFFTSMHVLFALGFDYDMPDVVSNQRPDLYQVGPKRAYFNLKIFTKWMAFSGLHGTVAWLIPNLLFGSTDYSKDTPCDFWVSSVASFIIVIEIVMLKLLLHSVSPCKMSTTLPSLLSVLLLAPVLFVLGHTPIGYVFQPSLKGIPAEVFRKWEAVAAFLIVPPVALIPDIIERILLGKKL